MKKQNLFFTAFSIFFITASIILTNVNYANASNNAYPSTAEGKGKYSCPLTVWEGEIVKPKLETFDPDYKNGYGPAGKLIMGFNSPLDKNGVWQTKKGDAGVYKTTASVNDGEFTDNIEFCIEVLIPNQPPVPQTMEYQTYVGDAIQVVPTVIDPDSPQVQIVFIQPITSKGIFISEKQGYYEIPYYVIDGQYKVAGLIKITVWAKYSPIPTPNPNPITKPLPNPTPIPLPEEKPIPYECKKIEQIKQIKEEKEKTVSIVIENPIKKQSNFCCNICDNTAQNSKEKTITIQLPDENTKQNNKYSTKTIYLEDSKKSNLRYKSGCTCTKCD